VTPQLILGAPIPEGGGFVQKIFFYHVPAAWVALLSVLLAGGSSAYAIFRRSTLAEDIADSAAELAVLFGLMVLLTGPLWARAAWGKYWVWDARLTTTLVLWLIFVVYLVVRRHGGRQGRVLAMALALFGALDVPLVWLAVTLWRTHHPSTEYVPSLAHEARSAFFGSLVLFSLFFGALLLVRLWLARLSRRVKETEVHLEAFWEEP